MTMAPTEREQREHSLNAEVAAEIRAWMGRRQKNQVDMARALGENEMWISRRIRGKQQMTITDLQRIAAVLEVSVLELFPVSRTAGRGSGASDLNASSGQLIRSAPPEQGPPNVRRVRHTVTGINPNRSSRHDSTRPASPTPPMQRRATRLGSPTSLI